MTVSTAAAAAKVSMRLVPDQTPKEIYRKAAWILAMKRFAALPRGSGVQSGFASRGFGGGTSGLWPAAAISPADGLSATAWFSAIAWFSTGD